MNLNQKGFTLTELIISIALITIIVMFLFRLLVDIRNSENNIDYNRNNQQTRAVILKNIEQDFLEKKLIGIQDTGSNQNQLQLTFTYQNNETATLLVTESTLTYQNKNGTEKWNLEKQTAKTKFGIQCVSYTYSNTVEDTADFYYVKFTIPVIVSSKSKNTIDDLEFFYLGEKKDLQGENPFLEKQFLGDYQANQCG